MEVKVKHIKCDMNTKDKELMNKFMKFLQKHYPLKNNITVIFTGERFGDMTTGSRTSNSELKILTKGRLNRDVSRTLAHEWVHEWQRLTKGKERGPDIGGENEDEANAKAGSIIKKFEKSNPKEKEMMYVYREIEKENVVLKYGIYGGIALIMIAIIVFLIMK